MKNKNNELKYEILWKALNSYDKAQYTYLSSKHEFELSMKEKLFVEECNRIIRNQKNLNLVDESIDVFKTYDGKVKIYIGLKDYIKLERTNQNEVNIIAKNNNAIKAAIDRNDSNWYELLITLTIIGAPLAELLKDKRFEKMKKGYKPYFSEFKYSDAKNNIYYIKHNNLDYSSCNTVSFIKSGNLMNCDDETTQNLFNSYPYFDVLNDLINLFKKLNIFSELTSTVYEHVNIFDSNFDVPKNAPDSCYASLCIEIIDPKISCANELEEYISKIF